MRHLGFIAHRFGRALGPDLAVSTLERLLASADDQVVGIEIDCVLSRDGELVLLHDDHLDETTTLKGWAHDLTAAEICAGDIRHQGSVTADRPMLLSELWPLLEADGRKLLVQLESKTYQDPKRAVHVAEAICDAVCEAPRNVRTEHISFWPDACEAAAARGLASRFIANVSPDMQHLSRWAAQAGMEGFVIEHPWLTNEVLAPVAEHGLTWTSGNLLHQWQYDRLLALEHLPQAVCTDYPLGLLP
jgi:glycerophosphoryl diester phosphodiesterase